MTVNKPILFFLFEENREAKKKTIIFLPEEISWIIQTNILLFVFIIMFQGIFHECLSVQ